MKPFFALYLKLRLVQCQNGQIFDNLWLKTAVDDVGLISHFGVAENDTFFNDTDDPKIMKKLAEPKKYWQKIEKILLKQ